MKKTLLVLSAILALSMAFVGCKKSSGSNEPDGSEPVTKGPVVILDPDTYAGSVGEVVEVNGAKWVKVTTDQYNTIVPVNPVADVSACKKVSGKFYCGDAAGVTQFAVQLMDKAAEPTAQAAAFMFNPPVTTATEKESNIGPTFSWIDYNDGQKNKLGVTSVGGIQVFAQNSSYAALDGTVIYLGKIVAQ